MITKDDKLPYDKTQLLKRIKGLTLDQIELMPEEWYTEHSVTVLSEKECSHIENRHRDPFIVLNDDTIIQYDALLIATGMSKWMSKKDELKNFKNCLNLETFDDHLKLQQ